MSSWRMKPLLGGSPVRLPKENALEELPAFQYEPPTDATLTEVIRFHVNELIKLSQNKQGRLQMILVELRKAKLAPRAKRRK